MDTYPLAQVSDLLGTSVPRVQRAIDALGVEPRQGRRGRELTEPQVAKLRAALGSTPRVEGFDREDLFVLAALSRRPLGLRSARAVARVASVSPTTASKRLDRFIGGGLVTERTVRLLEGEVVDVPLYEVAWSSPTWHRLAPAVRQVVLPEKAKPDAPKRVPPRLWHHFWNANPAAIRLPADEDYVAGRLLRSDDPQAIAWAATHLSAGAIAAVAGVRGMSDRDRSWLHQLAVAAA